MKEKIAVFDSGAGGISTLAELRRLLPNEDFLYFADNLNAPYGKKSAEAIFECADKCMQKIVAAEPKAIVLACNTVTSICVKSFREKYREEIIVGIQPAVKPATAEKHKKVLVFVTLATACSKAFNGFVQGFENGDDIIVFPLPDAAGMVEKGCTMKSFENYLREQICGMNLADFSSVVLGCTHFVLAKNAFQNVFSHSRIFDGNLGTAKMTRQRLQQAGLLRTEKRQGNVTLCLTNDAATERRRFTEWLEKCGNSD